MFFYKFTVYCVLLPLYFEIIASEGREIKRSSNKNDENEKYMFAKLLKTIVRVNEERMNALKKITQLQDYMLTKNKLKTEYDMDDSFEEDSNRIVLAYATAPTLRRKEDETLARIMCNEIRKDRGRKHFFNEYCEKDSMEVCIKACSDSIPEICDEINCNRAKIDFGNYCDKICKDLIGQ